MLSSVKSSKLIPPYRQALGESIRAQRVKNKLSQEKLAELANVHRNYIGLVERGEQNLTFESLVRISNALNIRPSVLLLACGL